MEKVVIIYQKQYEDLLRDSISENVDVVLWLRAELVNEDVAEFEKQIGQVYEEDEQCYFCLMISWRSYKKAVCSVLEKLKIDVTCVLDIYKTYMANFPIKRYRRIMDQRSEETLDGLVFGISHGMTGIVEERMPGNVCNLCESSQDIYFNYRVLESLCEEYPERIEGLKYVVFDMFDYTYFNFDTIQTGAYEAFLEESGFWCEERYNWNKQRSPYQINEWLNKAWQEGEADEQQKRLREVFPYIFEKDDCVYKGTTVLKSRKHILIEAEIDKHMANFSPSSLQAHVFENTVEFQICNFEKILKLLQNINPQIRVFLVLLPKYIVAEQCDYESNKLWKPFFRNVIEEFREGYPFLELLDMKNCGMFSANKNFYEDMTHFNYEGACRFTEYLSMVLTNQYGLLPRQEAKPEWQYTMLGQLFDAVTDGYLNEQTIGYFSCCHLAVLQDVARNQPGGKDVYLQIKEYLENLNIQRLKRQEKIVIGFIANYSSTWIGDALYHLFEKNERFEPYVFLIANHNGQSAEMVINEYRKNLDFFTDRNLRVVQTLDTETGRQYTWEEIGVKPQVCIWLTPWVDLFIEHFHLLSYSLDVLHTYIPYGFLIAENENNNFIKHQYDQLLHNISWCNFEDSRISVEMAEKYAFVGSQNTEYTGYPKMDAFFEIAKEQDETWKKLIKKSGLSAPKKIIYAPHHTLEEREPVRFSTFVDNYQIILGLAREYQSETIWVFKPHPQLKYKAIRSGMFKDTGEWDAYVNSWKQMQNAEVINEGTYKELFLESDAMILDSISFLAEYLYTHKPLLFLRGEKQRFNEFGKSLMEVHYCANGKDEKAMEAFVQKVVLEGKDNMNVMRENFYNENLNYISTNGKNAATSIYEWFCRELVRE